MITFGATQLFRRLPELEAGIRHDVPPTTAAARTSSEYWARDLAEVRAAALLRQFRHPPRAAALGRLSRSTDDRWQRWGWDVDARSSRSPRSATLSVARARAGSCLRHRNGARRADAEALPARTRAARHDAQRPARATLRRDVTVGSQRTPAHRRAAERQRRPRLTRVPHPSVVARAMTTPRHHGDCQRNLPAETRDQHRRRAVDTLACLRREEDVSVGRRHASGRDPSAGRDPRSASPRGSAGRIGERRRHHADEALMPFSRAPPTSLPSGGSPRSLGGAVGAHLRQTPATAPEYAPTLTIRPPRAAIMCVAPRRGQRRAAMRVDAARA